MGITSKFEYRRNLPHIQRDDAAHSLRFSTLDHWVLPNQARDLVFQHCLQEHEKRVLLHAVVVMPDHIHLHSFVPAGCDWRAVHLFQDSALDQGSVCARDKQAT
jgi:hypothetical protein